MRTIIHDLDETYDSLFKSKCENVIWADGRYAPCQGCFGCWTKHPAQCYMKDALQMNTFHYMVERNAINYGFQEFEFHNLENVNQLEEIIGLIRFMH